MRREGSLTKSLDRTRAGRVSFQFGCHWPPAPVSSGVRPLQCPPTNSTPSMMSSPSRPAGHSGLIAVGRLCFFGVGDAVTLCRRSHARLPLAAVELLVLTSRRAACMFRLTRGLSVLRRNQQSPPFVDWMMTAEWPNKITGPNAGGPRQFPIRTPLAARVGQLCR